MAKSLFERLKEGVVIEFDVDLPDGTSALIRMHVPTTAELWAIEEAMPNPPKPPVASVGPDPNTKELKRIYDYGDTTYLDNRTKWLDNLRSYRAAILWEETVPGETAQEIVENLHALPHPIVLLLKDCADRASTIGEGAVKQRTFQSNAAEGDAGTGADAVDEGAVDGAAAD